MVLKGSIWKEGRFWLVEVPDLDVATQGRSRREAMKMIADAIESLVNKEGFRIKVHKLNQGEFLVDSSNENQFVAFFLKRQREIHGLSVRDMMSRLEYKSVNAYAQYEQGRIQPSLSKIEQFLSAMSPHSILRLSVVES